MIEYHKNLSRNGADVFLCEFFDLNQLPDSVIKQLTESEIVRLALISNVVSAYVNKHKAPEKIKLINLDDQVLLDKIFSHYVSETSQAERWRLLTEWQSNLLITLLKIDPQLTPSKIEGAIAMSIAYSFTLFSSSSHFGMEYDSPIPMRRLAHCFLDDACQRWPELINSFGSGFIGKGVSVSKADEWKEKLLPKHKETFTCTATVHYDMSDEIKESGLIDAKIWQKINPF